MGCSGVTYPFVLMSSSTVFTVLLHAMSQSNTCNVYVLYSFISIKLLSVHSCSSQCMIFFKKKSNVALPISRFKFHHWAVGVAGNLQDVYIRARCKSRWNIAILPLPRIRGESGMD